MITRILCPLALANEARQTFEYALAFGRWYRAPIMALHVFSRWIPPGSLGTYPAWMRQVPEARAQIDTELHELLAPAHDAEVPVHLLVREGDAGREILACATTHHADLIVLGAHHGHRIEWLTHHTIPETVVRAAECPVLVVTADAQTPIPFTRLRCVIGATDFSEHARGALHYASSIAEHAGAQLTLIHVVEYGEGLPGADKSIPRERPGGAEFAAAEDRLRKVVTDNLRRAGVRTEVRGGPSARELARVVTDLQGDLLVVGLRGTTRTRHPKRIGTTTTQLLKCPPCSVLTVPGRDGHDGRGV